MDAAMHGHAEVIKLLLKAGVPVITTKQVMAILHVLQYLFNGCS